MVSFHSPALTLGMKKSVQRCGVQQLTESNSQTPQGHGCLYPKVVLKTFPPSMSQLPSNADHLIRSLLWSILLVSGSLSTSGTLNCLGDPPFLRMNGHQKACFSPFLHTSHNTIANNSQWCGNCLRY